MATTKTTMAKNSTKKNSKLDNDEIENLEELNILSEDEIAEDTTEPINVKPKSSDLNPKNPLNIKVLKLVLQGKLILRN